jgi:hypothetical protein
MVFHPIPNPAPEGWGEKTTGDYCEIESRNNPQPLFSDEN